MEFTSVLVTHCLSKRFRARASLKVHIIGYKTSMHQKTMLSEFLLQCRLIIVTIDIETYNIENLVKFYIGNYSI